MKKIAIIAIQYANVLSSFGALMQLWASSTFLLNKGYKADIINYIPDGYTENEYCGEVPNSMVEFRNKFMKNLTRPFHNKEQLKTLNDEYNIFITGSDQVWRNWGNLSSLYVYMMDFVNDTNKKIALSVSFGLDTWNENSNITKRAKELINRFYKISVREESGLDILKENFDYKQASFLVDPTLLLDAEDYEQILHSADEVKLPDNYIAKVSIRSDEKIDNILHTIAKKNDLEIVDALKKDIPGKSYIRKVKRKNKFIRLFLGKYEKITQKAYKINDVGKWLKIIKNANFVVTDSYHGLMFSIIFRKNFICVPNEFGGITRLKSFLKLIGQENRLIYTNDKVDEIIFENIDYVKVYDTLDKLKQKTKDFILEAIEN